MDTESCRFLFLCLILVSVDGEPIIQIAEMEKDDSHYITIDCFEDKIHILNATYRESYSYVPFIDDCYSLVLDVCPAQYNNLSACEGMNRCEHYICDHCEIYNCLPKLDDTMCAYLHYKTFNALLVGYICYPDANRSTSFQPSSGSSSTNADTDWTTPSQTSYSESTEIPSSANMIDTTTTTSPNTVSSSQSPEVTDVTTETHTGKPSSTSLTTGVIVGIVVGSAAGVVLVVAGICIYRRKTSSKQENTKTTATNNEAFDPDDLVVYENSNFAQTQRDLTDTRDDLVVNDNNLYSTQGEHDDSDLVVTDNNIYSTQGVHDDDLVVTDNNMYSTQAAHTDSDDLVVTDNSMYSTQAAHTDSDDLVVTDNNMYST